MCRIANSQNMTETARCSPKTNFNIVNQLSYHPIGPTTPCYIEIIHQIGIVINFRQITVIPGKIIHTRSKDAHLKEVLEGDHATIKFHLGLFTSKQKEMKLVYKGSSNSNTAKPRIMKGRQFGVAKEDITNNIHHTKVTLAKSTDQGISTRNRIDTRIHTKEGLFTVRGAVINRTTTITTPTCRRRIKAVGSEGEELN